MARRPREGMDKGIHPMNTLANPATLWLCVAAGLLLVLVGRRIFWLFVAIVGFVWGMRLAPMILTGKPDWVALVIGLFFGIAGALLAVILQRVAVAIAGGAAGAMLASRLIATMGWTDPTLFWAVVIAGAVVAAILAAVLFDWALVFLTTLTGALMVCDAIALAPTLEWAIGLALVALGIGIQGYALVNPPGSRT